MEAISPTPEDRPAERDDIKSTKDDLLQKISKVDREIAKAESQIAKLKKKQVGGDSLNTIIWGLILLCIWDRFASLIPAPYRKTFLITIDKRIFVSTHYTGWANASLEGFWNTHT